MGRNILLYWAGAIAVAILTFIGPGCAHDDGEAKVHAATPVAGVETAADHPASDVDHAASERRHQELETGLGGSGTAGQDEEEADTDAPAPLSPHNIYQQNGDRVGPGQSEVK